MIQQFLPTTVFPLSTVPLLIVTNSLIVVPSPISTVVSSSLNLRSCGIADITAPGKILQFLPMRAPSIMVTLLPIQVPSPITTLLWIVVNGSITTFLAIFAPGWTYASGWFISCLCFIEIQREITVVLENLYIFCFYHLCHQFRFGHQFIVGIGISLHMHDPTTNW